MEDASKEDFLAVMAYDDHFNAGLVDRLIAALTSLDEDWAPYPINRYQHSLQAASRAYPSKRLEFFEPMLRRVFSNAGGHIELNETRDA